MGKLEAGVKRGQKYGSSAGCGQGARLKGQRTAPGCGVGLANGTTLNWFGWSCEVTIPTGTLFNVHAQVAGRKFVLPSAPKFGQSRNDRGWLHVQPWGLSRDLPMSN
ncbi:hypothetical protein CT0861_09172 [Colletotrichum tofieldiae]|uniref:Uncharacterized protein n=1 Tax=Colletotrichum tofieldiae TaxID=708197 RepID=A0A166V4A1_9PEZI|nr:hypothetical protein CT0861_09172 [Colletotrichum tofieldiae]